MSYYSGYSSRSSGEGSSWVAALIGLLVVLVFGLGACVYALRTFDQTLTLCTKERVATDGGGEYRVYAVEGTFVMKDSLINGRRFNTADVYARLQVPSIVEAQLKGYRMGVTSTFPNILEVDYREGSAAQAREACINEGLIAPDLG